jgi:four helix bundle protein
VRRKHCELEAWKEAIVLVKMIYQITGAFPSSEIYSLSSQMRRAVVSIPCNIAEGAARSTKRQLVQFLYIARGSLSELETQFIIAKDLGYIKDPNAADQQIDKVFALLSGLIRSLHRAKQ